MKELLEPMVVRRVVVRRVFAAALLALLAGLFAASPAPAQGAAARGIALVGARIIDGTGAPPLEDGTLVIAPDGRIAAVGPSSAIQIPADVVRIPMAGKTIMPGLINAHGHLNVDANTKLPVREHLLQRLRLYAQYGVTTVVSLGSTDADEAEDLRIRDEQRKSYPDRARLYTAGAFAIGKTAEEARNAVDRLAGEHVDIVKYKINGLPEDMTPDVYGALVDEAKKKGLRTAVHIFYLKDAKEAIAKGTNILAHSVRDKDVDAELILAMKEKGVAYIPTLTRDLSVFVYEKEPEFFHDPFFERGIYAYRTEVDLLKDPAHQLMLRNSPQVQSEKQALRQAMRNLKILFDAGIPIAMGTDTGSANDLGRWQGYFEHVELELMVQAGLTPLQALTAATGDAARIMRLDSIGTLRGGNWADLLIVNGNPLQDIRNTRKIDSIWIAGRKTS
jgi:imidazolonepropionase-like amidohydrolase